MSTVPRAVGERAVVYAVGADHRYQDLLLYSSEGEFAALPDLGGVKTADTWTPPRAYLDMEEYADGRASDRPQPDIWGVVAKGRWLAMSGDVIERLEPFISLVAEALPLESECAIGRELFVLNVLNPLDVHSVIDTSASYEDRLRAVESDRELIGYKGITLETVEALIEDVRAGELYPVLYPAFNEDRLPAVPSFFAVDRFLGDVFLLDHPDEDDTLLRRIDAFELTGLAMTMVWSSETGPERLNLFSDV